MSGGKHTINGANDVRSVHDLILYLWWHESLYYTKNKQEKNACRLQQAEQVAVCLVRSGQHDNSNEQQVLVGIYFLAAGLSAAAGIAPLLHCCCSAAVCL